MALTIEYERPWVAEYQEQAIFCEERYGVVEATTKSGKTHGCILWLFEQACMGGPGQYYWWVAPVYTQAEIAYGRLKRALPEQIYHAVDSRRTLTLINGAVIVFKSGEDPDRLYGEDVYAAVIDEASRLREESWHAVRSTLTATRGKLRIIGNVRGRKNWAYKLARRAESGAPNMHYAKITAWDAVKAGILEEDEIEDAQEQLPEQVFKELYLAEPSDDGGNPFGLGAIEACATGWGEGPAYIWAWDLAKSLDWTVGTALNERGQVCAVERWNKTALPPGATGDYWDYTEKRIVELTNGAPALVESNGLGDPVLEGIQRRAKDFRGEENFLGFQTSSTSKQQILEGLAVAIQQRQTKFPPEVDASGNKVPLKSELEEFEYEITRTGMKYSAPEGLHDDCVMSLAMAWALYDALPAPTGLVIYEDRVAISSF
jgi:hypothetical protein